MTRKKQGIILASVLALGLGSCSRTKQETHGHVVLPESTLIGCRASACSQLWSDAVEPDATYPRHVSLDFDDEGVLGMDAIYDKATGIDDL
jgi:hypothetical protein